MKAIYEGLLERFNNPGTYRVKRSAEHVYCWKKNLFPVRSNCGRNSELSVFKDGSGNDACGCSVHSCEKFRLSFKKVVKTDPIFAVPVFRSRNLFQGFSLQRFSPKLPSTISRDFLKIPSKTEIFPSLPQNLSVFYKIFWTFHKIFSIFKNIFT